MEKIINIKKKYSQELRDINYILKNLEEGRYYENSGAKMDGSLVTNIDNIRKNLNDLINKIEYNKDSKEERIIKELSKIENK